MTRLRVWKGNVEISDDIETRNGKGNPFGWSCSELVYVAKDVTGHPSAPEHVGWLYCGEPDRIAEGFRYEIEEVPG